MGKFDNDKTHIYRVKASYLRIFPNNNAKTNESQKTITAWEGISNEELQNIKKQTIVKTYKHHIISASLILFTAIVVGTGVKLIKCKPITSPTNRSQYLYTVNPPWDDPPAYEQARCNHEDDNFYMTIQMNEQVEQTQPMVPLPKLSFAENLQQTHTQN